MVICQLLSQPEVVRHCWIFFYTKHCTFKGVKLHSRSQNTLLVQIVTFDPCKEVLLDKLGDYTPKGVI